MSGKKMVLSMVIAEMHAAAQLSSKYVNVCYKVVSIPDKFRLIPAQIARSRQNSVVSNVILATQNGCLRHVYLNSWLLASHALDVIA